MQFLLRNLALDIESHHSFLDFPLHQFAMIVLCTIKPLSNIIESCQNAFNLIFVDLLFIFLLFE